MYNRFLLVLFPENFLNMTTARKVAYIGIFVALSIVANMFLSIDVTPTFKLTFNYVFCFFSGVIFGPIVGFAISFLGDLLAFLLPLSGGIYWFPTGLCTGLLSFIPGIVFTSIKFRFRGGVFVKTAIAVVLMYLIVTCGLGALSNYMYVKLIIYADREYTTVFWVYLGGKILFSSIVSIVNYALVFALIPLFNSIKSLQLRIE
ncbi:MAG: ECF transporter S component [Clostridia bacterium]|nr:ECF transporter S component [Clostridia bacterium]